MLVITRGYSSPTTLYRIVYLAGVLEHHNHMHIVDVYKWVLYSMLYMSLVGGDWNMTFIFPSIGNNHPN